jgi:hypothetical protein
LAMITTLFFVTPVKAQCSDPLIGKWTDRGGPGREPASFDIYFTGCGDTPSESTSYGVRVWAWRSDGTWYGRPPVRGEYRQATDGQTWFRADVPTGGYLEQLFIRQVGPRLRVFIRWKSLDSKPDATEKRTFSKRV